MILGTPPRDSDLISLGWGSGICVQTPQAIRICTQNAAWLVKQKEHEFRAKHWLFSSGSAEISLPQARSLTAVCGSKSKVNPVRQLHPQFFTWTVIRAILFTYLFSGNWAPTILQVLHQVLGKHRWVNSPCAQEAPGLHKRKTQEQAMALQVCLPKNFPVQGRAQEGCTWLYSPPVHAPAKERCSTPLKWSLVLSIQILSVVSGPTQILPPVGSLSWLDPSFSLPSQSTWLWIFDLAVISLKQLNWKTAYLFFKNSH